jgi:hypothetical protein
MPAALSLPFSCFRRPFQKRAHLDRRPTGDHSLGTLHKCIIQISGFQHPKTAYVLIGLQVRPAGDEHLIIGLRPQRPRAAGGGEAANENPDTGSHHPFVERVDRPRNFASSRFSGVDRSVYSLAMYSFALARRTFEEGVDSSLGKKPHNRDIAHLGTSECMLLRAAKI